MNGRCRRTHGRRRGAVVDRPARGLGGRNALHEFRLHAGGHDISGFAPAGSPFVGLGHNAYLGWACTTGGPDTTDIYIEQLESEKSNRYRYDDSLRELTSEKVTIAVKDHAPVVRTLSEAITVRSRLAKVARRSPSPARTSIRSTSSRKPIA